MPLSLDIAASLECLIWTGLSFFSHGFVQLPSQCVRFLSGSLVEGQPFFVTDLRSSTWISHTVHMLGHPVLCSHLSALVVFRAPNVEFRCHR